MFPNQTPGNSFSHTTTMMPGMGGGLGKFPGIGMGQAMHAGVRAAQNNPNPLAAVKAPQQGLATAGGIQQAMQKAGFVWQEAQPEWLSVLMRSTYPQVKRAEVATGGSSAPAASTASLGSSSGSAGFGGGGSQLGTPANAPGSMNNANTQKGGGGQLGSNGQNGMMGAGNSRIGAFGIVRPGWASLRPNTQKIAHVLRPALSKYAMIAGQPQPTPGATANAPVPPGPPGAMPQQAPPPGAMPPPNGGAPVQGPPGQPSVDPATGQPIQQSQPAQPGQPGGDPSQGGAPPPPQGAIDPATGQPLTSPMQDPPPPPLPANPPMKPPRPANTMDHAQHGVIAGLGHDMAMADQPMNKGEAQEDMQSEAMAMGSKTAAYATHMQVAREIGTVQGREKSARALLSMLRGRGSVGNLKGRPLVPGFSQTGEAGSSVVSPGANSATANLRGPGLAPKPRAPVPDSKIDFGAPVGADKHQESLQKLHDWAFNGRATPYAAGGLAGLGGIGAAGMATKQAMDNCYANGCRTLSDGSCSCKGECESCNPREGEKKAAVSDVMGRIGQALSNAKSTIMTAPAGSSRAAMGLNRWEKVPDTLRKTYGSLAKAVHPDHNPGDAQAADKFRSLTDAFERLSGKQQFQAPTFTREGMIQTAPGIAAGGVVLGGAGAATNLLANKLKKQAYDECTPFAAGFFTKCNELGISIPHAIEKVGTDYGAEAAQELHDGYEKVARAWAADKGVKAYNWGRNLIGGAPKPYTPPKFTPPPGPQPYTPHIPSGPAGAKGTYNPSMPQAPIPPSATSASEAARLAQLPSNTAARATGWGGNSLKGNIAGSAGGAALGGFSGEHSPYDTGSTVGNMAMGAAAFNPYLNRMMGGSGSQLGNLGRLAGNPLTRGIQGGMLGSTGGQGLDFFAHQAGINHTNFAQLGGNLGAGFGTIAGGGRAVRNLANPGSALQQWGNKANQFGEAALNPIRTPIRSALGMKPLTGDLSSAGQLGRKAAGGAGLILGTRAGMQGLQETGADAADAYLNAKMPQIADYAKGQAGEFVNSAMPQIGGFADQYAQQRGLMNQQGQIDPTNVVKQQAMGHIDSMLHGMGMDPSRMSPVQKMMLMGGAGMGGAGALTMNPVMMGAGGLMAGGGAALSHFMPSQGQQRQQAQWGQVQQPQGGQPQFDPRNEFWHQQQGG